MSLALAAALLFFAAAPAASAPPAAVQGLASGQRLVVGMPPGAPLPPVLFTDFGAALLASIPELDAYVLDVPLGVDLSLLAALLVQSHGAAYAEGDRNSGSPNTACSQGPSDPWDGVGQQCTIGFADGNPSHEKYAKQALLRQIRARPAQVASTGTPNVVAVIDTGVDLSHPLIAGHTASFGYDYVVGVPLGQDAPNFLDDDGDGTVDEGAGHGTHVAGTILLVNPDALILPLRVLDSEGNGWGFDVARALVDAGKAQADVINLSLGLTEHSQVVADALDFALASGAGILAAAGNHGGPGVLFPSSHGNVPLPPGTDPCMLHGGGASTQGIIAVGAVESTDALAPFSAFGEGLDVLAPGVAVYGPGELLSAQWWSGTSQATAVASGAASLLLSVNPSYAKPPVVPLVLGAADVSAANPAHPCELGAGRIDLSKSLAFL